MKKKLPPYLLLNGFGLYYYRRAIPKHLQPLLQKTQIKKSLRTGNYKEAARLARQYAVASDLFFDSLEAKMTTPATYDKISLHTHFTQFLMSMLNASTERKRVLFQKIFRSKMKMNPQ